MALLPLLFLLIPVSRVRFPRDRYRLALTAKMLTAAWLLLACFNPTAAAAQMPEPLRTMQSGTITIAFPQSLEKLADSVAGHSRAALSLLNKATRDPFLIGTTVSLAATEAEFLRIAGGNPEHPVAVSLSGQAHVVINVPVYRKTSADQLRQVLIHELAHVYLDARAGPEVPRWMHEGVAQLVAGESTESEFSSNVFFAALTGHSLSLEDLASAFPSRDPGRAMAYAQSLSVVRFLVNDRYGGSLPLFLQSITGPDKAQAISWYRIPIYVRALQKAWRSDTVSPADFAAALAGTSVFWLIAVMLTLLAWRVRRRRSADIQSEWEREELEVLDQYQAEGLEAEPVEFSRKND